MKKYVMVIWPFGQEFMEHPRFDECYLLQAQAHQEDFYGAYFVPVDIFYEVMDNCVEKSHV